MWGILTPTYGVGATYVTHHSYLHRYLYTLEVGSISSCSKSITRYYLGTYRLLCQYLEEKKPQSKCSYFGT